MPKRVDQLFLEKELTSFYNITIFCIKENKERGDAMEKVTKSIKIDPELWHRARVKALSENMTLQELIAKLLIEYLGEKGGK